MHVVRKGGGGGQALLWYLHFICLHYCYICNKMATYNLATNNLDERCVL